jgi:hypothetical protein
MRIMKVTGVWGNDQPVFILILILILILFPLPV